MQEFLNEYFHDIRVIRSPANHGFGLANRGAAVAEGEYLLFLNSDAEVVGPALETMVNFMDEDKRVGVLGPVLLNTDGSFQLSSGKKISLGAECYREDPGALGREMALRPAARQTLCPGDILGQRRLPADAPGSVRQGSAVR